MNSAFFLTTRNKPSIFMFGLFSSRRLCYLPYAGVVCTCDCFELDQWILILKHLSSSYLVRCMFFNMMYSSV